MKKETKARKFKIGGLIALLAGGLAIGGAAYHGAKDAPVDPNATTHVKSDKLTIEQMQDYIQTADRVLARLQEIIDSPDTNPEQEFEAIQQKKQVIKERANMLKRLNTAQAKTIHFKDAQRSK